jgi:hypothetical protein
MDDLNALADLCRTRSYGSTSMEPFGALARLSPRWLRW